jgi:hypothetical protein
MTSLFDRALRLAALVVSAVLVAACGDSAPGLPSSDGGGSTGNPQQPTVTVTLQIINPDSGSPTNSITLAAPATARATVLSNGAPVANALVQFSLAAPPGGGGGGSPSAIAQLSPASGSALTDSAGRASVALLAADSQSQGATSVGASVSIDSRTATGSANFQVNSTPITLTNATATPSSIAALGTAQIQVTVGGVPASVPISVSFTSSCASTGQASLTTSALTVNGVATATYTDRGCGTQDIITATAAGAVQGARIPLAIQPSPATAIQFERAVPEAIAIAGSGGPGSAFVTFKVVNSAQQPVGNFPIRLSLTTAPGGVTLDNSPGPVIKNTGQDGTVQVSVAAGSQPGPVQVTAVAVSNATLTAVSSVLSVQSGLPTQSRFSLAVQTFNIEGWDLDGTQTAVTIRAADRVGNPVPDGTRVNFRTSGAAIQSSCLMSAGVCSVQFVSQNSRPVTPLPGGRVRVLAWTAGEESFQDLNGNNRYDPPVNGQGGEPFGDLGDPFVDAGFNGVYDQATDEFIPFNPAATAACAAAPVNLGFPSRPSTCDGAWSSGFVRQWSQVVLSGSSPGAINLPAQVPLSASAPNCNGTFAFRLFDVNQNPMPAGTTITATVIGGEVSATVVGTPVVNTTGVIPGVESTDPATFGTGVGVTLTSTQCSGNRSKSTTMALNFTSPRGLTTTIGGIQILY